MHRRLNVIYADRGNTKTQLIVMIREREERQTLFMKTRKGVAGSFASRDWWHWLKSKTKALVSLHLSSPNVIYADHGNPNTQFSYTQD